MNRDTERACWWCACMAPVFALGLSWGCVRNVTVCATYDRSLQRPTFDRPERDRAGASVCADVEPPLR